MASVRFPDDSRRKVERVDKAEAQAALDELVSLRVLAGAPDSVRRREATFAEVIEAWFADGCPNVAPTFGVVRDHDRCVDGSAQGVYEQVRGDVDVGALLLVVQVRDGERCLGDLGAGRGDGAGTHHSGTRPTTNGQLVPHNRETEGLGTIRALHADGRSIRAIRDRLNADGIPAKRCGRGHPTTVARILARETS